MGLVHFRATLEPSKQDLVVAWLPSRSWAPGVTSVESVSIRREEIEGAVELAAQVIAHVRNPDTA